MQRAKIRLEIQSAIGEGHPKVLIPLAVAFVFCCVAPFATKALIGAFAPEGLCSPLIPKLQPGLGKFDMPTICKANAVLWAGLFVFIGSYAVALACTYLLNRREFTLEQVRRLSWKPIGAFCVMIALITIFIPMLYINRTLSSTKLFSTTIFSFSTLEGYSTHQLTYLAIPINFLFLFVLASATGLFFPKRKPG